jgi:hypothetical protein
MAYCGGVNNFLVSVEQTADLSLSPARYLLKRNKKIPDYPSFFWVYSHCFPVPFDRNRVLFL